MDNILGILEFNGERGDPISGIAHLGNGYRSYSPMLMRFHCPDSWSPFGAGGINPYAYCDGDPVNRADPNGHHSMMGWLGIGIGVAAGILLTPLSGGTSLAVALSVVSVITAVASAGLAVAQQFVEKSNPVTAARLGWAALGTGILSGLSSAALFHVAHGAESLAGLLKGTSNRPPWGGMLTEDDIAETSRAASAQPAREPLLGATRPTLSASGDNPLADLPPLTFKKSGRRKAMELVIDIYETRNHAVLKDFIDEQGMEQLKASMGAGGRGEKYFRRGGRWLGDENIHPELSKHELRKLTFFNAEVLRAAPFNHDELRYVEHIYERSGFSNPSHYTQPGVRDSGFGPWRDLINFD